MCLLFIALWRLHHVKHPKARNTRFESITTEHNHIFVYILYTTRLGKISKTCCIDGQSGVRHLSRLMSEQWKAVNHLSKGMGEKRKKRREQLQCSSTEVAHSFRKSSCDLFLLPSLLTSDWQTVKTDRGCDKLWLVAFVWSARCLSGKPCWFSVVFKTHFVVLQNLIYWQFEIRFVRQEKRLHR